MGIRNGGPFSQLGRIRDRIRSTLRESEESSDERDSTGAPPGAVADSRGNLFQCPACNAVYIADEKRACSACDETVEEVRSTFAHESAFDAASD